MSSFLILLQILVLVLLTSRASKASHCTADFEKIPRLDDDDADCFLLSHEKANFEEARDECARRGAQLLTLKHTDIGVTLLVEVLLQKKRATTTFWLGADYRANAPFFKWLDKTPVHTQRTIHGVGNCVRRCCLSLEAREFFASRCVDPKYFICRYNRKNAITSPTPAATTTTRSMTTSMATTTASSETSGQQIRLLERLHEELKSLQSILSEFDTRSRTNWALVTAFIAFLLTIVFGVRALCQPSCRPNYQPKRKLAVKKKGMAERFLPHKHETREDDGFKEKDDEDDGRKPTVVPLCCFSP